MVQLMKSSNNLLLFITYHKISFPTEIISFRQAIVDLLSTLSPLYMFNYSFSRCLKWTFTEALLKKSIFGDEILSYFMKTLFETQLNYKSW